MQPRSSYINIRSCKAFVIPTTFNVYRLAALSVETPTMISGRKIMSQTTKRIFAAPIMFVYTTSIGEYSHDGTCLAPPH